MSILQIALTGNALNLRLMYYLDADAAFYRSALPLVRTVMSRLDSGGVHQFVFVPFVAVLWFVGVQQLEAASGRCLVPWRLIS